jgi:hypothetical protein
MEIVSLVGVDAHGRLQLVMDTTRLARTCH